MASLDALHTLVRQIQESSNLPFEGLHVVDKKQQEQLAASYHLSQRHPKAFQSFISRKTISLGTYLTFEPEDIIEPEEQELFRYLVNQITTNQADNIKYDLVCYLFEILVKHAHLKTTPHSSSDTVSSTSSKKGLLIQKHQNILSSIEDIIGREDITLFKGLKTLAKDYDGANSEPIDPLAEALNLVENALLTCKQFCEKQSKILSCHSKQKYSYKNIFLGTVEDQKNSGLSENEWKEKTKQELSLENELFSKFHPLLEVIFPPWYLHWDATRTVYYQEIPFKDLSSLQLSPVMKRLFEDPKAEHLLPPKNAKEIVSRILIAWFEKLSNSGLGVLYGLYPLFRSEEESYFYDSEQLFGQVIRSGIFLAEYSNRLGLSFSDKGNVIPSREDIRTAILHPLINHTYNDRVVEFFCRLLMLLPWFSEWIKDNDAFRRLIWDPEKYPLSSTRGLVRYLRTAFWFPSCVPEPEEALLAILSDEIQRTDSIPCLDGKTWEWGVMMNFDATREDIEQIWKDGLANIRIAAVGVLWELCEPEKLRALQYKKLDYSEKALYATLAT